MRIVFMGTPDFAVETLKSLVEHHYNVVGVVTMPDKPAGRGHKLQPSAVKSYALSQNLPLLQPVNLKDADFQAELKAWNADLQIVVAFRMLPESVWNMPPKGTINLHASLLPQYRGAAPINWAIINGDSVSGITTFLLQHEIDTGNIIYQESVSIEPNDDAGTLHDKLMNLGAKLVLRTVDDLEQGKVKFIPQPMDIELKPAPKIFKETCRINWESTAEQLHNFVRGLSPYPTAWSLIQNHEGEPTTVKIYKTEAIKAAHNHAPGTILTDGKHDLKIATPDGYLSILELQLPGKKRMPISDLLRGYTFDTNAMFI